MRGNVLVGTTVQFLSVNSRLTVSVELHLSDYKIKLSYLDLKYTSLCTTIGTYLGVVQGYAGSFGPLGFSKNSTLNVRPCLYLVPKPNS